MIISRTGTGMDESHRDPETQVWDNMLRAKIARELHFKYEDTVSEPLPERLTHLMEQLEERVQQSHCTALGPPPARRYRRARRSRPRVSPSDDPARNSPDIRQGT